MVLENIHLDEVLKILPKLLGKSLSTKQKDILILIGGMDLRLSSTTRCVKAVSRRLECAESTAWEAVSVFKELGILKCNGSMEITNVGKTCIDALSQSSLTVGIKTSSKAAACKTADPGSNPGSETHGGKK